jgi:hypothetical protein
VRGFALPPPRLEDLMNASRVAAIAPPRPVANWPRLIPISIATLVAIGFFVNTALPYLMADQAAIARYGPRRPWLLAHIAGGGVALLTGPVQLWLGLGGRGIRTHRRLGLAYAASVAISSIAAFYLAAHTTLGWVFASGITGLGIAWVLTRRWPSPPFAAD